MIKSVISRVVSRHFPSLFFRLSYFHNRRRFLHLRHPRNISEIWIRKLLDGEFCKCAYLADKYAVRDYVKQKGLERILVPLLGVWDDARDIGFDKLPQAFALKMNYGAGMNIVVRNKKNLDKEDAVRRLTEWMNRPAYSYSETHYNYIKRRIVCEEFIQDSHGGFPYDYKFMCLKGSPFCVLACGNRESGHADYAPYSLDWRPLKDYKKGEFKEVERPQHLEEMIAIAKTLSQGMDLVRVDLYDSDKGVMFGEMTLTPSGCIFHRWTQKAIDDMGRFYREQI